jgi:ssDNA-binding replication factor A large subunit
VNILGKIVKIFPVREYKKDNREGKVSNFILADQTGNIKTVLWDTHHISLIENQDLKEGDVVDISNASLRNNEIHLTGFSDIKKSQEIIENVKMEKEFAEKKIQEFAIGSSFKSRAIVVQMFEPRFFEVCPVCNSKAIADIDGSRCEKHGKILPKKRALLNLVLDDGSGNVRAVLFTDTLEKLGFKENELEPGIFAEKKKIVLGKEAFFTGSVRQNKLFNNPEFFVSDIEEINLDKLIENLES